ncbi:MAG: archaeal flagellar protein FlaJ [Thermoplasmata archaeon]|nr:archaeal flagellar protein FlaJ [Thermoplasmata archaeon]
MTSIPPIHHDDRELPVQPLPPFVREAVEQAPQPTRPTGTARTVYLFLGLIPALLIAIVVLVRVGILTNPSRGAHTPWDLSLLFIGAATTMAMAALVASRAPRLYERARSLGLDNRAAAAEITTLLITIPLAVVVVGLSFLVWGGAFDRAFSTATRPMTAPLLSGVAILLACAPTAYFSFVRDRNIQQIEDRFPDFLRDLNESHNAGMTMAQAIRVAARGDYGRLNDEVRRMAHQVSWGTPFQDALRMFAERVGTPLVTRSVALMIKATQAGGNVKDVLSAAARDARELKAVEAERRAAMRLYVIVVYVAFGVFLAVTAALQGLLIPSVLTSTSQIGGNLAGGGLLVSHQMTLTDFRYVYFGVGLVQALGSGMVVGVMSEGNFQAGLKHSAILVAIAILGLGFL